MSEDGLIDQLLRQGLDALQAGDRATAQALLRRVLERDPRNVQAWYAMAWTLPTARGIVWCLQRVLDLDPDHAEAAAYLQQPRAFPERFTARWLETDVKRLDRTLGSVATLLSEAEQLADEVDRRLASLERQAEAGDRPADADWAAELSALQRQLRSAGEVGAPRQRPDADAEGLPGELYGELGRLWKSLVRQQRELRRHKRRIERLWDLVTGRGRAGARARRRRLPLPSLVLICLGLLLLIISAVQAYPYIRSRLFSIRAVGAAFAWHELMDQGAANPGAVSHVSGDAATSSETAVDWPGASAIAEASTTVPPTATPAQLPPTRIVVPKLGIDAPVVPVSFQQARDEWEVPDWHAAGWHQTSAGLGVPGNTVLNGHNTTRGEIFRDLFRLAAGDVITLYTHDALFSYTVSEVLILPEAGQPRDVQERNASHLLPTEDERLTLVTCHPYGSLRNRLIVIAYPDQQ